MQQRQLSLLSALIAMTLLAAWQWLQPPSAIAPALPDSAGRDSGRDFVPDAGGPPSPSDLPPNATPLPPPAPTLAANPGDSGLWFRLLDAETNQPLAHTSCEMWRLAMNSDWPANFSGLEPEDGYWRVNQRPRGLRDTDGQGLLSVSCQTRPDRAVDDVEPAPELGFKLLERGDGFQLLFPVPPGCHPALNPPEFRAALLELVNTPSQRPFDLRFRRAENLKCRVVDGAGTPIADATVYAFPVQVPLEAHVWAMFESEAYYVTQQRSGGGADTPVPTTAGAIEEGLESLRWRLGRGWQSPDQEEVAVGVPVMWSGVPGSRSVRIQGKTDHEGRLTLTGLCRGQWVICAWSFSRPLAHTSVSIPRTGEVTLSLGPPEFGGVRVSLDWLDGRETPVPVRICCHFAPALGAWSDGSREGYISQDLKRSTEPSEILIGGLVQGHWLFDIQDDHGNHVHGCDVVAGQVTELQVTVGSKAVGLWKPYIRFGDRFVKSGSLYLTQDANSLPQPVDLDWPEDGTEPDAVELCTGEYVAWVPGLPGRRFTVQAGQIRTDVFDVPVAVVSFSIEQALAELLQAPVQDDGPIRTHLNLYGAEPFADAESYAQRSGLEAEDGVTLEQLVPGMASTWRLPPGQYRWVLNSYLSGTMTVSAGRNSIHFSMNSLPGLERLDITIEGASEDEPGSLGVTHARGCACELPELGKSPRKNRALTTAEAPQAYVFSFDHGRRHVVFAPPGPYVAWGYVQGRSVYRGVAVPGRAVLVPAAAAYGESAVELLRDEEDQHGYQAVAYSAYLTSTFLPAPGKESMVEGPIRLWVCRVAADGRCTGVAALDRTLKAGETLVVHLTTLTFEPPALLSIRCIGPGDQPPADSRWWSRLKGGPAVDQVIALDHGHHGLPAFLIVDAPDQMLPRGRAEFSFSRRAVPPGRYRIVPWPGAPERCCRTVNVLAGGHTVVEIDTSG